MRLLLLLQLLTCCSGALLLRAALQPMDKAMSTVKAQVSRLLAPDAPAAADIVKIEQCAPPVAMPTKFGTFTCHCYRNLADGVEHVALVKGGKGGETPFGARSGPILVRVHSECATGDIFGSMRCDCGPQLEMALEAIEAEAEGVLLYMRGQEGRGIGLGAKLVAYSLQERGVDTLDANTVQGLPVDSREYGAGAAMLKRLGVRSVRLISNNPDKFAALEEHGVHVVERVPSVAAPNPHNVGYLRTKAERMGHMLPVGLAKAERMLPVDYRVGRRAPGAAMPTRRAAALKGYEA